MKRVICLLTSHEWEYPDSVSEECINPTEKRCQRCGEVRLDVSPIGHGGKA